MSARICYVVNSVSETSVPATIATAVTDHSDFSVDILAWFDADSFEGDDRVGVDCLDAPQSQTGINSETYRAARDQLQQYDLIQAHQPHSGSLAKVIGHQLGIPLVSREGNTRDGFTRKGRIANGLTNGLADRIVPNSRAVYDSFTRWERFLIDEDRVSIIPNGVDFNRIERARSEGHDVRERFDIPQDAVIVGNVSLFTEQKALDILTRAVARASERTDHRLDLVLVGDGPKRSEIETLATRLGIADRTHITGLVERDTVYQILTDVEVYAMPSRWEGFSSAAVEALGTGTACVFSDIEPFLLPYRNVALFHRIDDADELADRIVEFTEDPELRHLHARRGRKLVKQKYTLESVATQYAKLYSEIL